MTLAAMCGALIEGVKAQTSVALVLEIPKEHDISYPTYKPDPGGGNFLVIEEISQTLYDYALEVRFGDRVVRLTGDEIMDALEGK